MPIWAPPTYYVLGRGDLQCDLPKSQTLLWAKAEVGVWKGEIIFLQRVLVAALRGNVSVSNTVGLHNLPDLSVS